MNVKISFDKQLYRKFVKVFLTIIIGAAFTGFFVGVNEEHPVNLPQVYQNQQSPTPEEIQPAVTYLELREINRSPNKNWSNNLDSLVSNIPEMATPIPTPDPQEKMETLVLRASRRAYHGAPPVVPHTIDQQSAESCLVCHGRDMRVEERIVPKISHDHYQSCTQCHVESDNRQLGSPMMIANTFEGLESPFEGSRAWPGAPPVIPHSTQMRNDCLSCHGLNARPGLRTTHPERQQCKQCHAPSAGLEQHPFLHSPIVFDGDSNLVPPSAF